MINIEPEILFKIITPVLLLSCSGGILFIGSLLYLFVYISQKERLFLTILLMGVFGFTFTITEILVIIFSVLQNSQTAFFFHKIEAMTALLFCFVLPMLLTDIIELGKKFKKFNTILYRLMFSLAIIIVIITFFYPDLFLSSIKPSGAVITPWNLGRGTPGILYRVRDVLIFSSVIYTFLALAYDILLHRRLRYLGLIMIGLIFGIITGAADIILGMIELHKGLFSTRIYSNFCFGITIFILLSMLSVLRWFLDQSQDIDNARKIESLGLFAGGIAHDFNNILTGILGNTSLLMSNSKNQRAEDGILADIEKAVYRAKTLTMQLLTFSRGGSPVKDVASIQNIVEETARFVLSGSDIKARITSDDNLYHADVDAGQISQVIQNLVLNARDAMTDKGGFIDIKMENIKMFVSSQKNPRLSEFIRIEITDYGQGIHERVIPYIFDPYFTTKGFGTGLGLSVSNSIIRKHGGTITVKSKPGEGTSFIIHLPATSKKESAPSIPDKPEIPLKGKILIMDDDPYLRPMLKKMIEHIGLSAFCVPDGDTAIKEFINAGNAGDPYNAVIMDLTISGGMGGVETSRKIREIDKSIPLIVASGYCDDPVMAEYEYFGFRERLLKPFTLDDIRKALTSVLNSDKKIQ